MSPVPEEEGTEGGLSLSLSLPREHQRILDLTLAYPSLNWQGERALLRM